MMSFCRSNKQPTIKESKVEWDLNSDEEIQVPGILQSNDLIGQTKSFQNTVKPENALDSEERLVTRRTFFSHDFEAISNEFLEF